MQEREFKHIQNIQKKCKRFQEKHTIQVISLRGQERQK